MTKWTLKIFVVDRRCKSGERLHSTTKWEDRDLASMEREVNELHMHHYPRSKYRIELTPATKVVKSLMTGKDVEIAYDTPRCCDPSSELYWSK